MKEKSTEKSQHVTGWTWKHEDFDQICPRIYPDIGTNVSKTHSYES